MILIVTFQTLSRNINNSLQIKRLAIIRGLFSLGYFLLLLRDIIPDIISVNIGNTVLHFCFFMDALMIIEKTDTEATVKKLKPILCTLLFIATALFNVTEFLTYSAPLRVTTATIGILLLMILPTIRLISSKKASRFKRGVAVIYSAFIISLIARISASIYSGTIELMTDNSYQTFFLLSQIFLMIVGILVHLLFMKEESDSKIAKMALTDGLTGLSNRQYFLLCAEKMYQECKVHGETITIIFIDIDDFKTVNDRYGHSFGDEVLKTFAEILKEECDADDLYCRYGGEEFLIMLGDDKKDKANNIAAAIKEKVAKPRNIMNHTFNFTVSIGILQDIPNMNTSLNIFIDKSDVAMYNAKQLGKDAICYYEEVKCY